MSVWHCGVMAKRALLVWAVAHVIEAKPVLYGYDVVEYFSLPASASGVKGKEKFAVDLEARDMNTKAEKQMLPTNFTFWFKNAENKAAFEADPWKYAPQWGGF